MFKNIKNKPIASNMVISAVCKPASMLISYIYVPFVLGYLGVEKYGVWSTILTILSWISFFDIGIGNGLRNRLTESLSRKDGNSRKLISSAYAFIAVIMIAVAVIFSLAASFLDWNGIFKVNYPESELTGSIIICILFVVINFVLSVCKNVLFALQKAADVSIMELCVQLLNLAGVVITMQFTEGSLFVMALVYGLSMISVSGAANLIIFSRRKDLRPEIKSVSISAGKSITNLGLQFFVIQICALILYTTDSLIISYLYGAADVTPYNTMNKIFNVIIGIYTALITPVWSSVTKYMTEGRADELKSMLKKLRLIMIPFFACAVLAAFILRPFSALWLGQELDYSDTLICFGCAYCILILWCNTYAAFTNGLEIMKVPMILAVIESVINIPVSVFLAQSLGLGTAGVLGGTLVCMMIAAVAAPILVRNKLKELEKAGTVSQ